MVATWSGDLDGDYLDSEGLFGPVGTLYRKTPSGIVPLHFQAQLYYDTDLGITTVAANGLSSTLSWNPSDGGNSPFLGADVTLNVTAEGIPPGPPPTPFNFLVGPGGSFSFTRGAGGFEQMTVGNTFGLTLNILLQGAPGGFSIDQTDPLSVTNPFGDYGGAFPHFHGALPHSHSLTVIEIDALPARIAALPEPSSWAMLIAGFGAIGLALRSRRARVPATA
jgi:hypothetical protein